MLKLKIVCVLGVFLMLIVAAQAQNKTEPNQMELVKEAIDNMSKVRKALFCLSRSCDPLGIEKMFSVDDSSEMKLKQNPNVTETNVDRVIQLASVTAGAVTKLLTIEPNCHDHFYQCSDTNIEKLKTIPSELFEFNELLGLIVSAEKCITTETVAKVINLLSESVVKIRNNVDTSGTSMQRLLPAVELVAQGLEDICTSAKGNGSMDVENLGEAEPILLLVPAWIPIDNNLIKNALETIKKYIGF